MKLYLISQSENDDYDTYDSAVVVAPNVEAARDISPSAWADALNMDWENAAKEWGAWASHRDKVKVTLLGTAHESLPVGVVCASYNAG